MNKTYDFTPLEQEISNKQAWEMAFSDKKKVTTGIVLLVIIGLLYILVAPILHKIILVAITLITVFGIISSTKRNYKLKAFIKLNSLEHLYGAGVADSHKGFIFRVGSSRSFDGIGFKDDAISEIGNCLFTTGSGKSRRTHIFGVIRLKLAHNLPHMVLDSKANNVFGENLATVFSGSQKLSLEGDFDKHFTLYTPKEYERDALYVFTPELMQILVDEVNDYDVEVLDNDLYLYSPNQFNLTDSALLKRLLKFSGKVAAEFRDNTDLYKDERVQSSNVLSVVAQEGQRLQRKAITGKEAFRIIYYIFVGAFILFVTLSAILAIFV